ncbi:MAG: hypothetical protein AMJ81_11010, partial [Phycisphaerae bacterium SM23_33]
MNAQRFEEITARYGRLKVVVAGDFCLDRYLEIDPALEEVSLETHLPAHQVVNVRPQAGGAGTVLANVAALKPAEVRPVGLAGRDGEGYELVWALRRLGARMDFFLRSARRRTFTYTKPLVLHADRPPEELPRLDIKDHTPVPASLVKRIIANLTAAAAEADVIILLEQVTASPNGVLSAPVKDAVAALAGSPAATGKVFLADSRCDPGGFANVHVKVNAEELRRHFGSDGSDPGALAARWSAEIGRCVFVTLGPDGMVGAEPAGLVHRAAGLPVSGPIDIVGAGDAVSAHLAVALAAGASAAEAITLANLAGG